MTAPFADLFRIVNVDDDGIFWHSSGAASYAWLAHPISAEHLTGAQRHSIADRLGRAIGRLPSGATIQFIQTAVRNIDWALADYQRQGGSHMPLMRQYESMRVASFQEWARGMEEAVGTTTAAKDIQVMIVLTLFEHQDKASMEVVRDFKDALSRPYQSQEGLSQVGMLRAHTRTEEAIMGLRQTMLNQVSMLEEVFHAVRMPCIQAQSDTFVRFVRTMIHPNTGPREPVVVDASLYLPELICRTTIETDSRGKFLVSDDVHQGMLTAESWPRDNLYAGMLSLTNQNLDNELAPIDLMRDAVICLNCRVVDRQEALEWVDERERLASGDTDRTENREVFADIEACRHWVKTQNRRMVDVELSVKVVGEDAASCADNMVKAQSYFQALEFGMRIEDHDALTIWAEQLPGGYQRNASADSGYRARRRLDIAAGALAPIYQSGRGTRRFVHMCFNEHFEPFAFNQFDHPRAFNLAVVAESGGGKSQRITDIITDHMRAPNAWTSIVDFGGSFVPTMALFDQEGLDVRLSLKRREPMNVFAGPGDVCIPMLLDWLPGLALAEGEHLAPTTVAKIEGALRSAYKSKLKRNVEFYSDEDLLEQTRGAFPTNVRKRFSIACLNEEQQTYVADLLRGDEVAVPRFQVYYVMRLRKYTSKHNVVVDVRSLGDIDREILERLRAEFAYVEEVEGEAYVLSTERTMADTLGRQGWVIEVDDDCQLVEAERQEDYEALIKAGVSVIYDDDYMEENRERITIDLAARFGRNHAQLEEFIAHDLRQIDAREYWDVLVGFVDVQDEVIFSDFIREAKNTQDPELLGFIERLGLWYGEGAYAEFFDRRGGPDVGEYAILNFDFKPIFKAQKAFVIAMLGAVLTRILVFCDSYFTMNLRKMIVVDEFQQFRTLGPTIEKFMHTVTLQARKSGYGATVGTQKFEHLKEANLIDQFQHFLIGGQLPSSHAIMRKELDLNDEQLYVASKAQLRPGKYSDFLLYIPATGVCDITRSVPTAFELWLRTTYGPEREMRNEKALFYQREMGYSPAKAIIMACKDLAEEHPRGLRPKEGVSI